MNYKKYIALLSLFMLGLALSCTTDESLFPLPYNNRTVGAYTRVVLTTSGVFDLNNIASSGYEAVYEPVDEAKGSKLSSLEFYATHRRGSGITGEVLVKTIDNSGFAAPPAPTYSVYKRQKIRITAAETLAALANAPAVAPPEVVSGNWPSGSVFIAPPGTYAAADQVVYRWVMVMSDGRRISVANPQSTNPQTEIAQNSADIANGAFYLSPFQRTITVRALTAGSYVGTYGLKQMAIWSPNHSATLHQLGFPKYMNQVLFPNQVVTLSVPAGGLSTEREFTVQYRGSTVTMRINLENNGTSVGLTGAAGAAALATMNAPSSTTVPFGLGFSGASNANLGFVFVPLRNSTVSCTSARQLYWITAGTGTFGSSSADQALLKAFPVGLPLATMPNRGLYRTDQTGLVPGQVFSISVDDDCDEYGRGSGYCTWTRRVYLTLTKQ